MCILQLIRKSVHRKSALAASHFGGCSLPWSWRPQRQQMRTSESSRLIIHTLFLEQIDSQSGL